VNALRIEGCHEDQDDQGEGLDGIDNLAECHLRFYAWKSLSIAVAACS
jgi:hypothetical protein